MSKPPKEPHCEVEAMTNTEYEKYEAVFAPIARRKLGELRNTLSTFWKDVGVVEVIDRDVERGLGFVLGNGDDRAVELMLNDGDENGYEGVGLHMTASSYAVGVVWAPCNFTAQVGTTDLAELQARLESMDVRDIAQRVNQEWLRIAELETGPRHRG